MKKTMRYLSMAALALVGAMMSGCSSEDIIDNPQQPENKDNVVTLTTTVSLDGGDATRALTAAGVKTFAVDDQIAVMYSNVSADVSADVIAVSNKLKSTDISAGGKTATFTVTLVNPYKEHGVAYIYPASMILDSCLPNYNALYSQQDGTLATLGSKFDYCTKTGSWNNGELPTLTLENRLAILAITLKDASSGSEITDKITGLTVSVGTDTYNVSRTAAAGPIYVAIRPATTETVSVLATDGTKYYAKTLSTKQTYAQGNGYNVTWRMAENTLAKAIAADKGKLICTDGHIHTYGVDDGCTKDRVAMIAYVGATGDATYSHGLALALEDVSNNRLTWNNTGTNNGSKTAAEWCSAWNTSKPVTGATWLLASQDQWGYMLGTNGVGSYTALRDGFTGVNGTNMVSNYYWTSTESNSGCSWVYDFTDNNTYGGTSMDSSKNNEFYVRPCLAF